jgi:hypothetical protein
MRTKHTFRLPPDLAGQLADHASRKRVPQALIVETVLASFLSPDNSERMEAALGRRLDRLTRHVERLESVTSPFQMKRWPCSCGSG